MIKQISDDCYEVAWPIHPSQLEAIQREKEAKAEKLAIERRRAIMQRTLPQLNVFKYIARKASGTLPTDDALPEPSSNNESHVAIEIYSL